MEAKVKPKTNVKSVKSRRDKAVQGTNDLSTVSKCSMMKLGYFLGDFLKYFVAKQCRRSPLIHRGYHIRTYVIDYLLKEFLTRKFQEQNLRQIISLGAGFDSTYFRLKSQGLLENCVFYEVDFPQVVKRKAEIIKQTPELKSLIGNKKCTTNIQAAEIFQDGYKLLGVDLTQVNILDSVFRDVGVDVSCPTLILSECVLTYLSPQHSNAVILWAQKTFPNSVFVDYEQINPSTAFGLFMQKHFASSGSHLKCINTYPSIQSHKERFLQLGWSFCECLDMNSIYMNLLSEDYKSSLDKIEPFDEFEEWHLKCAHYMILCAQNGTNQQYINFKMEEVSTSLQISVPNSNLSILDTFGCVPEDQGFLLRRFGHSCVLSLDRLLFTFGGFGKHDQKYQRICNILVSSLKTFQSIILPLQNHLPKNHFAQMYQTACVSSDGSKIIIFGGRQSPENGTSDVTIVHHERVKNEGTTEEFRQIDSGSAENLEFCLDKECYKLTINQLETNGDGPSERWRHTSIIYEKNDSSFLFVYGGRNKSNSVLDDGFILDLQNKHWTKVKFLGDIPEAMHSHSCSLWNGQYLVLAGGLLQGLVPSQEIYLIDISSFSSKRLKVSGCLYPRYSHTAHIIDDHLILVGGVNFLHFSPGVAVVNLLTGISKEFTLPVTDKLGAIQMHHGHQSVCLDNTLVMIGGGGNCFSFGTHLNQPIRFMDLKQYGIF